jgi:transcription factor SPN1
MKNTAEAYPYLLPAMAPDPRVQRVRRSESFCAPSNSNPSAAPRQAFKRAPSFGALAQGVRENKNRNTHSADAHNNSYPSSDEEEKIRSRQAKRPRTKTSGSSSGVPASPPTSSGPSSPATSPISARTRTKTPPVFVCTEGDGKASVKSPKASLTGNSKSGSGSGNSKNADVIGNGSRSSASAKPKMNLQRNPSIFGCELPHLHINVPVQVQPSQSLQQPRTPVRMLPPSHPNPMAVVATQKVKTLRRVRRLAPARRISFGSLVPPADGDDADVEGEGEEEGGLGSASQLQ